MTNKSRTLATLATIGAASLAAAGCSRDVRVPIGPTGPTGRDTVIVRQSVPSLVNCSLPAEALRGDLVPGLVSAIATEGKTPDVTLTYDGTPITGKGAATSQFIAKGPNYSCTASVDGVLVRADKTINVTPLTANISANPLTFIAGGNTQVMLSAPVGTDSIQLYKNGAVAKDAAGNPLKAVLGNNGQLVYTRATPGVDTLSAKAFNNLETAMSNNVAVTATPNAPPAPTTAVVVLQPVNYASADTNNLPGVVGTVTLRNKLTGALYQQTNTAADKPVVFPSLPGGNYDVLLSAAAPGLVPWLDGIQTNWQFSKLGQKPTNDGASNRRPYTRPITIANGDSLKGQIRFFPARGQRGSVVYEDNQLHRESTSMDDDYSGIEGPTKRVVLLDCLIPGGTVHPGYTEFPNRASADSADAIAKKIAVAHGLPYVRVQSSNPQFVRGDKVLGYHVNPAPPAKSEVRSIWTRKTDPADKTAPAFTIDESGMYLYNPNANNAAENNAMRNAIDKFLGYGQTNDSQVFGDQALRVTNAADKTFGPARDFFADMRRGVEADPTTWRGVVSFRKNLSPLDGLYRCTPTGCIR